MCRNNFISKVFAKSEIIKRKPSEFRIYLPAVRNIKYGCFIYSYRAGKYIPLQSFGFFLNRFYSKFLNEGFIFLKRVKKTQTKRAYFEKYWLKKKKRCSDTCQPFNEIQNNPFTL